jgi:hypothetical protein
MDYFQFQHISANFNMCAWWHNVGVVRADRPGRDESQGAPWVSQRRAAWWTAQDGSAGQIKKTKSHLTFEKQKSNSSEVIWSVEKNE